MNHSLKELIALRWSIVPYWKRVTAILMASGLIWLFFHLLAGWEQSSQDSLLISAAKELIIPAAGWLQWLLPGMMAVICIFQQEKDQ